MPSIVVDKDRCKGCELCINVCPQQVIAMSGELNAKGYFFATLADAPRCLGCRICAITCPDVAISVHVQGSQYTFFEY